MNLLTVGQRLPLSQLKIDENSSITVKFNSQSPIEMNTNCFGLNNNG